MLRAFFLNLMASFIGLLAFDAKACSVPPRPYLYSFEDLDRRAYRPLNDQGASISLVKTVLIEERELSREELRLLGIYSVKSGIYQHIKFEVLDVLYGAPPVLESKWYPKLRDETVEKERNYANASRPFEFWDRMAISMPIALDHTIGAGGMCFSHYKTSLAPDFTYLSFTGSWPVSGFEPVSGPNHSLVKAFKSYVSGQKSPALRDAADYFAEINGYAEIEIVECPIPNEDGRVSIDNFWMGRRKVSPRSNIRFQLRDAFNMSADDISMAQFAVYRGQIENYNADWNEKDAFTCSVGERFLVLDRVSDHPRVPDGYLDDGTARKPPSQRFLRYSSYTQGAGRELKKIITQIPESELLTRIQFTRNTWPKPKDIKKTIRQSVCAAPNRDASFCSDVRDSIETNLETAPFCTPRIMECDSITLRDYLITDFSMYDNQRFDRSYGYNLTPYQYKSKPRRLANVNQECALKDFSTTLYLPENVRWTSTLTHFLAIQNGMLDVDSEISMGSIKIMPLKYATQKSRMPRRRPNVGYVEYRARLQNHPEICEP